MENMKLSPPWVAFVHEVEALFEDDGEIRILYDQDNNVLKLFVDDVGKADALSQLIPAEKIFGNVTLKIEIIPSNKEVSKADLFEKAFAGNSALEFVFTADTPFGKINYAIFKNKVVQFFNDQMDDINGNRSTLFQDIAKDVFGTDHGVFYCTEAVNPNLQKPLGEWP